MIQIMVENQNEDSLGKGVTNFIAKGIYLA